jgi:hypothetical protein
MLIIDTSTRQIAAMSAYPNPTPYFSRFNVPEPCPSSFCRIAPTLLNALQDSLQQRSIQSRTSSNMALTFSQCRDFLLAAPNCYAASSSPSSKGLRQVVCCFASLFAKWVLSRSAAEIAERSLEILDIALVRVGNLGNLIWAHIVYVSLSRLAFSCQLGEI